MAKPDTTELERLAHPSAAANFLGGSLYRGSLALLLGAGVSAPLGGPSFPKLIDECLNGLGELPFAGSDSELGASRVVDIADNKGVDLRGLLTGCLYPTNPPLASRLISSTRLGALGAMLMGSKRGSVNSVLTLNFDSLLEEYLLLHGYVVNVVTKLPSLIGSEDVSVFHPHGYLPSKSGPGMASASSELIFSKESVLKMLGSPSHATPLLIRQFVRSKVLVMLGISPTTAIGNALGPILLAEADGLRTERPSAFWIGAETPQADFRRVLLNANIVPVVLDSFEKIDEFLLEVCREAARQIPL